MHFSHISSVESQSLLLSVLTSLGREGTREQCSDSSFHITEKNAKKVQWNTKLFIGSTSQWSGGVPQMASLDVFKVHHLSGFHSDLCPVHPRPGDQATGLSSNNPLFLLTGWGRKWIFTCPSQHNGCSWEREAKKRMRLSRHTEK